MNGCTKFSRICLLLLIALGSTSCLRMFQEAQAESTKSESLVLKAKKSPKTQKKYPTFTKNVVFQTSEARRGHTNP